MTQSQEEASRCFRFCKLRKWAFKEMEQKQKEEIPRVKKQSVSLQTHITNEFSKMHQILTEKEQRLLRDLREEEERILETMEKNLRGIQENLTKIQDQLSFFQKPMEKRNKEESWDRRFQPMHIVGHHELCIEKFTDPLSDPFWKEMQDAINLESPGAVTVSVTLDVETANPMLEVPDDQKSLKFTGPTRVRLPDNGKRFADSPCVLGSEGFTSGRHYWEVDVTGNRGWRLGVAAESVERKQGVSLCPENRFWTIGQDGNQLYINTSPRSNICVSQIPEKVGVYLNYESGSVSFYSAKIHLHIFTGNKFTEKLYPFFFTSDLNKCLKICPISATPRQFRKSPGGGMNLALLPQLSISPWFGRNHASGSTSSPPADFSALQPPIFGRRKLGQVCIGEPVPPRMGNPRWHSFYPHHFCSSDRVLKLKPSKDLRVKDKHLKSKFKYFSAAKD